MGKDDRFSKDHVDNADQVVKDIVEYKDDNDWVED